MTDFRKGVAMLMLAQLVGFALGVAAGWAVWG